MALVATLSELKAHLNYTGDTSRDVEMTVHLEAASDWVEGYIGGPLAVTELTERVQMSGRWIVPSKRPLVSVTSITPDLSGPLDSSIYVVDTDRSAIRLLYGWDYTHSWGLSRGWCTVVYLAGLQSIPSRIKLAGLILAAHLWQTQNGGGGLPFPGDSDPTPTLGLGFAVPNRVKELLGRNNLPGIG